MKKYLSTCAILAVLLSSVFVLNACGDCDYNFLVGSAEDCGFIADDLDCDDVNFSNGDCQLNGCECVDEECDLVYPFDFDIEGGCLKLGSLDLSLLLQNVQKPFGI